MILLLTLFLATFVLAPVFFIKAGWRAKQNHSKSAQNQEIRYFVIAFVLYVAEIIILIMLLKIK